MVAALVADPRVLTQKGFSFSAYVAPIECSKYAPMLGPEQQPAIGLGDKRHPKVGKTYKLKQVENRTEVKVHLLTKSAPRCPATAAQPGACSANSEARRGRPSLG
jgi:hypothetical protein